MPQYQITAPDGSQHIVDAPDGATQDEVLAYAKKSLGHMEDAQPAPESVPNKHGLLANIGSGLLSGATDIGTTLMWPVDAASDALMGQDGPMSSHQARKTTLARFYGDNADIDSAGFIGGKLASSIAGTAGVGGALAKGATALPMLARFAPALESGGFSLGGGAAGGAIANAATRAGAGALTGGVSSAMLDPENAGMGAAIGGALPGATQLAGALGKAASLNVSPAVASLYQKAQAAGINVPIDRLTNSPLANALAASLRYIPLSGRAATEDSMLSGLNRAASRTMGEDTANLAQALRSARANLGAKFDSTLSSTAVTVDQQLLNDLATASQRANAELVPAQAAIIDNQINDALAKAGQNGAIDGQAFYNLKKTLDRVATRNTPEAFYAQGVRNNLIDALNRSLGPQEAAAFSKVREQYGNMKTLQKIAPNGAEGEITAGRLGALRNTKSKDLQDVADIAAQFVKTRENPHGAMQRVFTSAQLGALAAGPLGLPGGLQAAILAGGTMAGGRMANTALNSKLLAKLLLNPQGVETLLANPGVRALPGATLAAQGSQQ